ncbi:hypothetical protein [Streptomyces incanus]|uniref:Transposase n=1 Tax=Streptomyces incanus TaxID=887453 RepID=A0ABW0XUH7_9ACTN
MLDRLVEAGLLKAGGRQRTDATHVLAAVRSLSRLELVGETLRAALEELAEAAPAWLTPLIEPEWAKRYGRRVEIGKLPGGKAAVTARAEEFGRDGQKILAAAWAASAPPHLRLLPQVEILRQVWVHHYFWDVDGSLRWRDGHALPPASLRFDSPYDTDAHYCVKRDTFVPLRGACAARRSARPRLDTACLRRTSHGGLRHRVRRRDLKTPKSVTAARTAASRGR